MDRVKWVSKKGEETTILLLPHPSVFQNLSESTKPSWSYLLINEMLMKVFRKGAESLRN
jgi:hypothetical protein